MPQKTTTASTIASPAQPFCAQLSNAIQNTSAAARAVCNSTPTMPYREPTDTLAPPYFVPSALCLFSFALAFCSRATTGLEYLRSGPKNLRLFVYQFRPSNSKPNAVEPALSSETQTETGSR